MSRVNEYSQARTTGRREIRNASERNPRIDPRVGDVLRQGHLQRSVYHRHGSDVYYEKGSNNRSTCCWITTWREWARGAEVLKRGSDDAERS
jgi:hypothetical protein